MRRALPLRIKLTAHLLVLLTGGLGFIGVISISMLHSYLLQRVDRQIELTLATTPTVVPADTLLLLQRRDGTYRSLVPVSREVDRLPKPRIPSTTSDVGRTVPADRGSHEWRIKVQDSSRGRLVVAVDLRDVHDITHRLALIVLLAGGGVLQRDQDIEAMRHSEFRYSGDAQGDSCILSSVISG